MPSKITFALTIFSVLWLTGCGAGAPEQHPDEYIVGQPLSEISGLTDDQGKDSTSMAIYDSNVGRIHQFNLTSMTLERSLSVINPGIEHYVLYHDVGNYVIDLSTKHISVFNHVGRAQHQPIRMMGTPKSAAFRPSLGYLVLYDDQHSVGIMKLNDQGDVSNAWVGGPLLADGATIMSGDVDEKGRLVLALTGGTIAVVDLQQTLFGRRWDFQTFNVNLTDVKWIAPVPGSPDHYLANAQEGIALIDVVAKTVSVTRIPDGFEVRKMSKVIDPHIILQNDQEIRLLFVRGGTIQSIPSFKQSTNMLASHLNLKTGTWTFIDSTSPRWSFFEIPNADKKSRVIKRYEVNGMGGLGTFGIPDDATVQLMERSYLVLYPSKLGKASTFSLVGDTQVDAKDGFNVPYIGLP